MENSNTNAAFNGTRNEGKDFDKNSTVVTELHAVPFGIINGLLVLPTLWMLVFMIGYGCKMKKFNRTAGGMLNTTCVIAISTALLRFIMDEVIFFAPRIKGALDHCELLIDISSAFSAFAITSTYVFLWMRQRAIYAGKHFANSHHGRCIRILSRLTLAMFLTLAVVLTTGYILSSSFTSSDKGCVYKSIENRTQATIKWDSNKRYALGGYLFFTQIALLSLFVYPLFRLRSKRQRSDSLRKTRKDKIYSTIKRSILCAAVASFSDLSTVFLIDFVPRGYPIFVSSTFYNISAEISVVCILATFGKFRRKLSLMSRRRRKQTKATKSVPLRNKAERI